MGIEITIDFSKLSRQQMKDLLKSCSREDRLNLSSDDKYLNDELVKILDFDSLKEDEILALTENAYAALDRIDKSDFISDRLSDTSDDNIEDYYKDNIDNGNDEAVEEADYFDPDAAEDPPRCWMMKQILRAFNHSRIDPTREEAMETVKQMYNFMGWK